MQRIFRLVTTWWNGMTIGTWLYTSLWGRSVGQDEEGNTYYQTRDGGRRWVVYAGESEASRVPPGWHGWLHGTQEQPPSEAPLLRQPWERPHIANRTGLPDAWRPAGSLHGEAVRPHATGDYEAWTPPGTEEQERDVA